MHACSFISTSSPPLSSQIGEMCCLNRWPPGRTSKQMMFCLPVCARAIFIALSMASEPELAKKKRVSCEGQIFSIRSSSAACTPAHLTTSELR